MALLISRLGLYVSVTVIISNSPSMAPARFPGLRDRIRSQKVSGFPGASTS
jgi:hypothetical protein